MVESSDTSTGLGVELGVCPWGSGGGVRAGLRSLHTAATIARSEEDATLPVGLWGVFKTSALTFGDAAAARRAALDHISGLGLESES